jgi:hypothetical protein
MSVKQGDCLWVGVSGRGRAKEKVMGANLIEVLHLQV